MAYEYLKLNAKGTSYIMDGYKKYKKNYIWTLVRGKKSWKGTFYSKNKQIQLEFMQFWEKLSFDFWACRRKNKMKCQFQRVGGPR